MALPETYTPNLPGLKPYPRDANGKPLPECGSELFTARVYVDTTPVAVKFALDIKKFTAFVETGSNDIYVNGNAAGFWCTWRLWLYRVRRAAKCGSPPADLTILPSVGQ